MDSDKKKKCGNERYSNKISQEKKSLKHGETAGNCPESSFPISDVFKRLDNLDQKLGKIEQLRELEEVSKLQDELKKQIETLSAEKADAISKKILTENLLRERDSEAEELRKLNINLKEKVEAANVLTMKLAMRIRQLAHIESDQKSTQQELLSGKKSLEQTQLALNGKELKLEETKKLLLSTWTDLQDSCSKHKKSREDLLLAWENLKNSRLELKKARSDFRTAQNELRETRISLKQSRENLAEVWKDLQATRKAHHDDREKLKKAWQDLRETRHIQEADRAVLKNAWQDLCSTRQALKESGNKLQSTRQELRETRIALKDSRECFGVTWSNLQTTREKLNQSNTDFRNAWKALQKTRRDLKNDREKLQVLRKKLEETIRQLKEAHSIAKSLQSELRISRIELKECREQLVSAWKDLQTTKQNWNGFRRNYQSLRDQTRNMQQIQSDLSQAKAENAVFRELLGSLQNRLKSGNSVLQLDDRTMDLIRNGLSIASDAGKKAETESAPAPLPELMEEAVVPDDLIFTDEIIIPEELNLEEIPLSELPESLEPVIIPEDLEEEEPLPIPEDVILEETVIIPEELKLEEVKLPETLTLSELPVLPEELNLEEVEIPGDLPPMSEVVIPEELEAEPEIIIPEDLRFTDEIVIPEELKLEETDCGSPADVPEIPAEPVEEELDESIVISVILPVYNQADLAISAIESVIAQTYKNWELLIIDDGSTDHLAEAVKSCLTDKRIRYLKQKNQKLSKALNNGFALARGNFLTWTSADNIMHPQMLRRLSTFLRKNPVYSMVYADYSVIDSNGEPFVQPWFRPDNKKFPESPEIHLPNYVELLNIVRDNFIGACFMYRRTVPMIIGEYDPILGIEDYDYWMRINSTMKISHLGTEEMLYQYRVHENSLSARMVELNIAEKCENLMEYERDRWTFQCKEFEVYALFPKTGQNFRNLNLKFHYSRLEGAGLPDPLGKRVLLVKGCDLSSFTPQELEQYNFIGAYFDPGTANDAGKNAYLIRNFNIQCFAKTGTEEFDRLQVITPNLFNCQFQDFGYYSMLIANNRIFFQATHSKEELKRVIPSVPENQTGKIIIMLQKIANGGMEQVAFDMARNFRKAGKNAVLLCIDAPEDDVRIPEDLELIIPDQEKKEADFCNLLTKEKTAAVIAHFSTWGAKEVHKKGIPFYQVIHNTYTWLAPEQIEAYQEADKYTAAYIAVSANVAWYSIEVLKLPAKKMVVIENGVEFENFQFSEQKRADGRKQFGFTGNEFVFLAPANCYGCKGQLNLVLAFAAAYRKNPNLRLILAGKIIEAHYFMKIQKIIAENQLENVIISDYFNNMETIYCAADAVVLPSFWEGCSLAVAEARHLQRPLLATRVGDIERQTNHKNCILIDLPFKYLTELRNSNCTKTCYSVNPEMVEALETGIQKIIAGEYPHANSNENSAEQSAAEVYDRYLKLLNLHIQGKFTLDVIRHNI